MSLQLKMSCWMQMRQHLCAPTTEPLAASRLFVFRSCERLLVCAHVCITIRFHVRMCVHHVRTVTVSRCVSRCVVLYPYVSCVSSATVCASASRLLTVLVCDVTPRHFAVVSKVVSAFLACSPGVGCFFFLSPGLPLSSAGEAIAANLELALVL